MKTLRHLLTTSLAAAVAFGTLTLLAPDALAGGKGKGGGKPTPPPPCGCAVAIEISPGVFCLLDSCAELLPGVYECNYVCPFPY